MVERLELQGTFLSVEFAMSESNLHLAMDEASIEIEVWTVDDDQVRQYCFRIIVI